MLLQIILSPGQDNGTREVSPHYGKTSRVPSLTTLQEKLRTDKPRKKPFSGERAHSSPLTPAGQRRRTEGAKLSRHLLKLFIVLKRDDRRHLLRTTISGEETEATLSRRFLMFQLWMFLKISFFLVIDLCHDLLKVFFINEFHALVVGRPDNFSKFI